MKLLKGYSLFLIYKINIFIKLLKLIYCQFNYIFLLFSFVVFGLSLLVGSTY
jgi:hypothetical protein